jgi:hypothetical protein
LAGTHDMVVGPATRRQVQRTVPPRTAGGEADRL